MTLFGILTVFTFMFGICVGSFLNVVIYRLPRGKSLVHPPSSCPHCNYRIPFYLNIPLLGWLCLRGKCANCKAPVSIRYFIIELVTGLIFLGLFFAYFKYGMRDFGFELTNPAADFLGGGWFIYLAHLILIVVFLAASAIDLELWIIPLSLCWFVSMTGFIASATSSLVLPLKRIIDFDIFPMASLRVSGLSAGALVGLIIAILLLSFKIIKPSYDGEEEYSVDDTPKGAVEDERFNDRLEVLKELLFVLPIIVGAIIGYYLASNCTQGSKWVQIASNPIVNGFLGSFWGYIVGCGVVWATRILGTLGFGKEAMGMGDVHLMGAAGAVIGPVLVTAAFFIAPFFGLAWALLQMFFRKTRQIPYGPFLSIAVIMVIIFHDELMRRLAELFMIRF